ncbi:MAG: DUF4011 domain-containing protein, partial [Chloroflexi bacterium]|nr:DUF4011 domain-containing protein [Chloroflexota bacterium]
MSTKPVNAITSSSVALARQRWIQRLIDTSRRNNLLYYRPSKTGTLDLSSAPANLLRALLDGDSVPIHKLLLPPTSDVAAALARISSVVIHIRRRAQANLEDKSIETLYMTMGMASWQATDGGRNAEAAILLLPVEIDLRGRDGRNAQLRISGEPQFNLALAYVLKSEFGVKLDEEALLTMPTNDQGQVGDFDPHTVYQRLQQACANIAGFVIAHRAVLGNFSFQKMAMVRDLQDYAEQLATHPIIGALAGDVAAQKALSLRAERDPVPSLDSVPPDQDFTILDADSSQQYVVMAVCKGQSGVIQGPPGTGKSQTIVNMIVALAAQGKRVLFVAEKRAALEVVKDRLDRVGVGRLVLDLHGADFSQRELMRRVADGLAAVREASPAVDTTAQHAQFTDVRQRLNEHVTRLHTLRAPAKKSVFELQGELLRSPAAVQSALRWRGADLAALTPDVTRRIEAQLEEATAISDLITRKSPSLWVNADLKEGTTTAQVALDAAQALAQRDLQLLRSSTQQLAQATQLPVPNNLHDTEAF